MKTRTVCLYIIICSWCMMGFTWGDALSRKTKKGNELFEAGQYEEALQAFTEADVNSKSGDPRLPKLYKNMGNTYAGLGKYDQAAAMYQKAQEVSNSSAFKADVQYNAGNSWFKQQQYQQALESYKQALELDPKHEQAQKNKELVEKLVVQQQQQQQQQQNQQDQQDRQQQDRQQQSQNQQNEKDSEDEQQQEQQKQEQEQQEQEQQQPQEQQAAEAEESPEDKEQQLSEEEALRILDALKEKEELQQQQVQSPPRPVEKDW